MKHLKKIWVRVLISLLFGGVCSEINHIRTGSPSIETSNILVWMGAIITFVILSLIVWFDKYKYYFFPPKDKETEDESILDDLG
jgi:ABC-type Mn2+/Zn2+ transport system permease subunit